MKKDLRGDLEIHIKYGEVEMDKKIKDVNEYELLPKIEELTSGFNSAEMNLSPSLRKANIIQPLSLKIKYMGRWLIKVKHDHVPLKFFGRAVYDMSLCIQRTHDQIRQGTKTDIDVIKVHGNEKMFGEED